MNNILTLFHGYVGLLLDNQQLDKPTLEGLAKIQDGARAASELMDRTHSLVRPSSVVWREVDLADVLRRLRPAFEALCGPKVELQVNYEDHLPRIWADMGRVKTAIMEIVRNACDAVAGGGTVTIRLEAEQPAPVPNAAAQPVKWVSLTVSDDGPGIPKETMGKIFAPFFSTKRKKNAAGLGLTVALGFVQQHGGVIQTSSTQKRTSFKVLLPARSETA